MDSVCEEAGPREPSKVCQSEIKCDTSKDVQKEVADGRAITEVHKLAAGATPASSETPGNDPVSVPERRPATAPKPGNPCGVSFK